MPQISDNDHKAYTWNLNIQINVNSPIELLKSPSHEILILEQN